MNDRKEAVARALDKVRAGYKNPIKNLGNYQDPGLQSLLFSLCLLYDVEPEHMASYWFNDRTENDKNRYLPVIDPLVEQKPQEKCNVAWGDWGYGRRS